MTDYIQKNKEAYDAIAKPFASTRQILWEDLMPLKQYTKDGDRVLDLGCGTGRLYQLFDKKSIVYTGVDQSEGQLLMAKKQYPDAEFVQAEMTALPFADDSFDIIYCIATLHHVPTHELRRRALQEMKRILKPGGRAILTNWNLDSDWANGKLETGNWKLGDSEGHFLVPFQTGDKKVHGVRHYWKLPFDYLKELFTDVGFEVEKQYYSTRGEGSDIAGGDNIVSVVKKVGL